MRTILFCLLLVFLGTTVYADRLCIDFENDIFNSYFLDIYHVVGATEDYDDGKDLLFLEAPEPALDIYSKTTYSYPIDRLTIDARPAESMTTVFMEIGGRGIGDSVDTALEFYICDPYGENNFLNKTIIADLYDANDNLISSYNVKSLIGRCEAVPVSMYEGLSYKLEIKFYDDEDVNRDRIVNFFDYAAVAVLLGSTGHGPHDDYAGGADITREGNVDIYDICRICNYWLLET